MFDRSGSTQAVDTIVGSAREENAAGARRLTAIGDLYLLRAPDDDEVRRRWVVDGYASLVAEVSIALQMSRNRAASQVKLAIALRERLPKVANVYASGAIDAHMITIIASRTAIIADPELMAHVDHALADQIGGWTQLSEPVLKDRIDDIVGKADPAGVRTPEPAADRRHVTITPARAGSVVIRATVDPVTAAAIDAALDALAARVCPQDPRTAGQRRVDAMRTLATGHGLTCQCGQDDCPMPAPQHPTTVGVTIHLIAGHSSLTGDPHAPGLLPGLGLVPADQLVGLAPSATVREVAVPPPVAEPRYRPSAALDEFIRCRDLTCRFPHCNEPATNCDIDHTIPYPAGPTHPSKLRC